MIFKCWWLIRVESNKAARSKPLAHVAPLARGFQPLRLQRRRVLRLHGGERRAGDVQETGFS